MRPQREEMIGPHRPYTSTLRMKEAVFAATHRIVQ